MSKKEKLIERLLALPKDFQYTDAVKLLRYFDYEEVKTGKTSGSRVRFMHASGNSIRMHKPHPDGRLKEYQLKQLIEHLGL